MSDYAQATDFGDKDALSPGNPAKAVRGSELDTEYSAISVAILSKYDSTDLASQSEAEAAADNTKLMTPLRTQNALDGIIETATKVKTAAETVNNSSTLQDDDHITSLTITAAGVYSIFGVIICSLKVASDLKLLLVTSQTPTLVTVNYFMVGATAGSVAANQLGNSSAAVLASSGSNEEVVITVRGVLDAHATNSGTLKLQWAQNSPVSENTVLNIGSFITAIRVA